MYINSLKHFFLFKNQKGYYQVQFFIFKEIEFISLLLYSGPLGSIVVDEVGGRGMKDVTHLSATYYILNRACNFNLKISV